MTQLALQPPKNLILETKNAYSQKVAATTVKQMPAQRLPIQRTCDMQDAVEALEAAPYLEKYEQFDPNALQQTYFDEKLDRVMPSLCAFDVTQNPEVRVIHHGATNTTEFPLNTFLSAHSNRNSLLRYMSFPCRAGTADPYTPIKDVSDSDGFYAAAAMSFLFLASLVLLIVEFYEGGANSAAIRPTALAATTLAAIAILAYWIYLVRKLEDHRPVEKGYICTMNGIIPDHIMQKVQDIQKDFEEISIVAEVTDRWSEVEIVRPKPIVNTDPLVIGMKRFQGKPRYFLIDAFDLTRVEEYVRLEFCS